MSEEIQEQEATIAEGERPSWLPENFKSGEDLARSYKEAQAALTRTQQELAEQRNQIAEIAAQQQQQVQQSQYSDVQSRLYDAIASGDPEEILAAQAWIAQEAARAAAEQAIAQYQPPQQDNGVLRNILAREANAEMESRYPDWGEVRDEIAGVIQQNPGLVGDIEKIQDPSELANRLETAYKVVKFNHLSQQQQQVVQGAEEANRLMKQSAQTITGASQGTEPPESYWDSVVATPPGDYKPVGRL